MLTKLLKHEFRAIWKVPAALDAVLIVLGIIAHIMIRTIPYIKDSIGFIILMILFAGIYYIGIIAANIVTLIFLVMRYYRNLYTPEGYLTFTLPVSTESIINAKVISGFIWEMLAVLSTVVSVLTALSGFIFMTDIPYDTLSQEADDMLNVFGSVQGLIMSVLIMGLVSALYNVLSLYFSVTLGQLWAKHKILGAVLCYIGIYIMNLIIGQASLFSTGFYTAVNTDLDSSFVSMYSGMLNRSTVSFAILSVIFYIACIMITKRKVNLD